mmetsp:Transcript_11175/g.35483  ORF Transcript_11175/g.35483 Transcript_11175/m.35483 type:complete len:239 (-) Transcript_11175:438-1154(-)
MTGEVDTTGGGTTMSLAIARGAIQNAPPPIGGVPARGASSATSTACSGRTIGCRWAVAPQPTPLTGGGGGVQRASGGGMSARGRARAPTAAAAVALRPERARQGDSLTSSASTSSSTRRPSRPQPYAYMTWPLRPWTSWTGSSRPPRGISRSLMRPRAPSARWGRIPTSKCARWSRTRRGSSSRSWPSCTASPRRSVRSRSKSRRARAAGTRRAPGSRRTPPPRAGMRGVAWSSPGQI